MTRLVPVSIALGCVMMFTGIASAAERSRERTTLAVHLASYDLQQGINIQEVKHGHHGHHGYHGHHGHHGDYYGHHRHHDRSWYHHTPSYYHGTYIYRPYPVYTYPYPVYTRPNVDGGFYLSTPRFSVGVGF